MNIFNHITRNTHLKKAAAIFMLFAFIAQPVVLALPTAAFSAGIQKAVLSWDLGQEKSFITYSNGTSSSSSQWIMYAKDDKYGYIITKDFAGSSKFWHMSGGSAYSGSLLRGSVNTLQNTWSTTGENATLWNKADGNGNGYIVNHQMSDVGVTADKLYVLSKDEFLSYGNNSSYDATSKGGSTNYSSVFSTTTGADWYRSGLWGGTTAVSWTRTGVGSQTAHAVDKNGAVNLANFTGYDYNFRVALQIDLDSSLFCQYLYSTAEGGKDSVSVGQGFVLPDTTELLSHKTVKVDSISGPGDVTIMQTVIGETVDTRVAEAGAGETVIDIPKNT